MSGSLLSRSLSSMSFLYADCSKAAARPVRVWSRRRLCALHARSAASSRGLVQRRQPDASGPQHGVRRLQAQSEVIEPARPCAEHSLRCILQTLRQRFELYAAPPGQGAPMPASPEPAVSRRASRPAGCLRQDVRATSCCAQDPPSCLERKPSCLLILASSRSSVCPASSVFLSTASVMRSSKSSRSERQ